MPVLSTIQLRKPTDSYEFEKMCRDYLIRRNNLEASLFGRRGQKQYGIDIVAVSDDSVCYCAQCKNVKRVTIKELDSWISIAEESKIPMKKFYVFIATDNDAKLQKHILKMIETRKKDNKFSVRLVFWDEISDFIKTDKEMFLLYYPQMASMYSGFVSQIQALDYRLIENDKSLLTCFFEEATKYKLEVFLNASAIEGIYIDTIWQAELFKYSLEELVMDSIKVRKTKAYKTINEFLRLFNEYFSFLATVTEAVSNVKFLALNKYHTKEEHENIIKVESLRVSVLALFNELKEI